MRARMLTAAAAAACVALALPAHAATKPQMTDAKGDSPVAGADIISTTFKSTFKRVNGVKKPTGFTLQLALAAAPASEVWYQIQVAKADCPTFVFEYSTGSVGEGPTGARCEDGINTKYETKVPDATVSGNTVTWKVSKKIMPVGTVLSSISGVTYNFVNVPGVVSGGVPAWDQAAAPTAVKYTVGK